MKILSSDRVVLHSPHPPQVCLELLRQEVDSSWWPWRSAKSIAGRISGTSITIRKNIRYRNSFQMVLTASLNPLGGGTELDCRIGLHPMVKAFMAVWFGFLGLGFLVLILASAGGLGEAGQPGVLPGAVAVIVPVALMLFGVLLVRFGKYLSRGETVFLTGFLKDLLEAREVVQAEPIN